MSWPADLKRRLSRLLHRNPTAHRFYRRIRGLPPPPPTTGSWQVWVRLPTPARSGAGGLLFEAPVGLTMPRILQAKGLAGYEREALACFLAVLDTAPAGPVWDVGANIGVFALLAASLTDRDVLAFEPTPETLLVASNTAVSNHLRVDCRQLALGAESALKTFYLSTKSDTSNSLQAGFKPSHASIDVQVDTIDRLVEASQQPPAVLKLDTEMTEPDVLRGGMVTVSEHRPWILCEVLPRQAEGVLQAEIEPHGYHWYPIDDADPLERKDVLIGNNTYPMWLFAPEVPEPEFWARMSYWRTALEKCQPGPQPRTTH